MTTQNLALLKGLGGKMGYLNQRQGVISHNIANADTPGYRAQDIKKPDFSDVLRRAERQTAGQPSMALATSAAGHITPGSKSLAGPKDQRDVYEVTLSGNAVVLEEQMIKSQDTVMDYNLMTSLYQKNVGMIITSLGRR